MAEETQEVAGMGDSKFPIFAKTTKTTCSGWMTATVEAGAQLQMAMRLMGRIFILITTEKKI